MGGNNPYVKQIWCKTFKCGVAIYKNGYVTCSINWAHYKCEKSLDWLAQMGDRSLRNFLISTFEGNCVRNHYNCQQRKSQKNKINKQRKKKIEKIFKFQSSKSDTKIHVTVVSDLLKWPLGVNASVCERILQKIKISWIGRGDHIKLKKKLWNFCDNRPVLWFEHKSVCHRGLKRYGPVGVPEFTRV